MTTLAPSFLIGSSLFFAGSENNHNFLNGFEIQQDQTRAYELAALERLEKSP